jgi:hypothetical protein
MRRAGWGILAGTIAALAAPPAYAADNPAARPGEGIDRNDKATRDAQARFVEGLARVKGGDFEAARLSFAQAYVVLHKPDILWNLALSEEKSGHVVDALGHFKELGRMLPPTDDRTQAKKHIDALMAQTGHLEVVAPSGTKVDVDGAAAGVAPLEDVLDVLPGKHHVVAGEKATDTDVSAGQMARVNFLVIDTPSTVPVPPEPAPAPPAVVPPSEGAAPKPAAFNGTPRAITVIGVGAAAVGAAALGVAFGLQSQSSANTAAQLRGNDPSACAGVDSASCSQLKDAVDAQNRNATLSAVFYVSSGVLAASALAAWLLWPTGSAPSKASIVPALAPAGWGPGLLGRF